MWRIFIAHFDSPYCWGMKNICLWVQIPRERKFFTGTREQGWAIALLLFFKRATRSNSLFCSLPKERQRQRSNRSFAHLKRATKRESLFCSLQNEQQRAIRSFALFQKSGKERFCSFALYQNGERAHKRGNYINDNTSMTKQDWIYLSNTRIQRKQIHNNIQG